MFVLKFERTSRALEMSGILNAQIVEVDDQWSVCSRYDRMRMSE